MNLSLYLNIGVSEFYMYAIPAHVIHSNSRHFMRNLFRSTDFEPITRMNRFSIKTFSSGIKTCS